MSRTSSVSGSTNGNIFTSQFGGAAAAGTPLRGTINIKLSSQSGTVAALRGGVGNAASSLADEAASSLADEDDEEISNGAQRTNASSSFNSSLSSSQVWTCVTLVSLPAFWDQLLGSE